MDACHERLNVMEKLPKKEPGASGQRNTFTTVWQSDSIIRLWTPMGKQHWKPLRMTRLSMVLGIRTTFSPMLAAMIASPTLFLSMAPIPALYGSAIRAPFVFNLKKSTLGGCQQPKNTLFLVSGQITSQKELLNGEGSIYRRFGTFQVAFINFLISSPPNTPCYQEETRNFH